MASETKIEWCDDSVSFWWGCQKVAPGCKFCYSEAGRGRKYFGQSPRLWIKTAADSLRALNRKAEREGTKRLVFINSMSDLFENYDGPVVDREGEQLLWPHNAMESRTKYILARDSAGDEPPVTIADLRKDFFEVADECPHLILICLTKRPENIKRMWPVPKQDSRFEPGIPADDTRQIERRICHRHNVWLLTSVSDQATADKNIPELLKCLDLCPVLGVSAEPLLGPLNLKPWLEWLDWVIVGGESGPNARPCDGFWIKSLVEQCSAANVPCFVKQLGSHVISRPAISHARTVGKTRLDVYKLNKLIDELTERITFKHSKGGDPSEWPEDLRVRQFPHPTANGQ